MELRDVRRLSPEAQEELRVRAVRAVVELGKSQTETAELFGVSRPVVCGWVSMYRSGGVEALKSKKRGPKARPPLDEEEKAVFLQMLKDYTPEGLGYTGVLWTRETVKQLLKDHFKRERSKWTVGRYMRSMRLTPQIPTQRAYQQSGERVKAWIEEEFPAIRERAEEEGADIHWLDEAGVSSHTHRGTTWAPAGETPAVPAQGKRFSTSYVASITDDGQLRFMVYEETMTAALFITFLKRLIKHAPRKVFLILDRHSSHTAKDTSAFVEQHSDKIQLFFLPSYSPDLNVAEGLNNHVKGHIGRSTKAPDGRVPEKGVSG